MDESTKQDDYVSWLKKRPENPFRFKKDRGWVHRMHPVYTETREEFNALIKAADGVDQTVTRFARLSLHDTNLFDSRSTTEHPHGSLSHLIDLFFDEDKQTVYMGNKYKTAMKGYTAHQIKNKMEKFKSLHVLQSAPVFTTPITVLTTPTGWTLAEPGVTRRVFANVRPESLDVIHFDYRTEPVQFDVGEWFSCDDYTLSDYQGIKVATGVFSAIPRYEYDSDTRYFKYIEDDRIAPYYRVSIHDNDETFVVEKHGNQVYVNEKPLCEKVDGKWRMHPY